MNANTGRDSDKFMLRFPEGMRDEIKRLAVEDGRSMNAQIIELLTFALSNSGVDVDEILQMLGAQRKEMADLRQQIGVGSTADQSAEIEQIRELADSDFLALRFALQHLSILSEAVLMNEGKVPERLETLARDMRSLFEDTFQKSQKRARRIEAMEKARQRKQQS